MPPNSDETDRDVVGNAGFALDDRRFDVGGRIIKLNRHEPLLGARLQILEHALIARVVRDNEKEIVGGLNDLPFLFDRQHPADIIDSATTAGCCRSKRKGRSLRPPTISFSLSVQPGLSERAQVLKPSTKQRFMAIEFDYPTPDIETAIVQREAGIAHDVAVRLVKLGGKVRNLKNHGLEEGVSTRLLIYAGTLMREGVATERACDVAIARPITDDPDMQRSIMELVKAIF